MIIIGIDPGLATTGYGIIKQIKNLKAKNRNYRLEIVDYGCIETNPQTPIPDRLKKIYRGLCKIINKHNPKIVAIETIFFFKNAKTITKVSEAKGIAILACSTKKIELQEFTPLQIKQVLTKYGRASKDELQRKVKQVLKLKDIPKPDDASDALACAICCARNNSKTKKKF